jgi:uncharacterized protein (TIGR03067 family)
VIAFDTSEIPMYTHWLLLPVVMLIAGAGPKPASDAEKVPGVWRFTSSERDGKAEPCDPKNPLEVEFTGETFRFSLPAGASHPQGYKLDPTAKPKAIDWLAGGKHGSSKPLAGIYELDGDTLKICWGTGGGGRPKEFTTKAETGEWLWVLKRAKKE